MKQFVGKAQTRKVPFMDGELEIRELTVGNIRAIEAKTKEQNKLKEADRDQLDILRFVLRLAVVDAEEMSDEDFDSFPVSELTSLSEKIMGSTPASGNE
jgi:hypothetical protein